MCTACAISRKATEGAVDCPAEGCDDNSGNDAYAALVDTGCASDCSSDSCRDQYFTLRVTHDKCDHDALSRAAEEGLHDMEVSCDMHVCNFAGAKDSQLVCKDEHGKSMREEGYRHLYLTVFI